MREAIRSGMSSGETERMGYSVAGVARRSLEVVGCGDRIVGEVTSSTLVFGIMPLPVRTFEGKICSKPCSRATFSMLLKYYRRVSVGEKPMGSCGRATYLDGLDLQLEGCILVYHNHGMRVQLQARERPHVVDALLNAPLQSKRLALTEDDDNNLPGFKNSLDTHSQGHLRDLVYIVAKESGVGKNGGKAGPRFVESNVAILSNSCEEQIDATSQLDGLLVSNALSFKVGCVAV
jgi:hypothetical protein